MSQAFWRAFSRLCDLIRPVTLDCINATRRETESPRWFWIDRRRISLADQTSGHYLSLLFTLLIVVTPLQLYVWVSTHLSRQVDDQVKDLTLRAAQLTSAYTPIATVTLNPEQEAQAGRIRLDANTLEGDALRTLSYVFLLQRLTSLDWNAGRAATKPPTCRGNCTEWFDRYQIAIDRVQTARSEGSRAEVTAGLISGTLVSFVLPILLGAIGAVAYVIRAISDQIRTTTFFENSPTRHLMRVMLGAMMGVVVGLFAGLSGQLSLPPLAPWPFSRDTASRRCSRMFDGMVARFRQPPAPAPRSRAADAAHEGAILP